MCFRSDKVIPPTIATSNIPIMKVLSLVNGTLCAYFMNASYCLNKQTPDVVLRPQIVRFTKDTKPAGMRIERGYHSYLKSEVKFCRQEREILGEKVNVLMAMIEGECRQFYDERARLCTGYIPKGAEYYTNSVGEVVSSSIVLTEIVELKM